MRQHAGFYIDNFPILAAASDTIHRNDINPFIADPVKALHFAIYPPFLIFDIRALWRSALSARAPECQKLIMVG